jgi:MFS family permease
MRKSLFSLLGLITFWSLFYAGVKYFFWWIYADTSFAPTLEGISGFVLIGSMIAYIIGWPLYALYSERVMLFIALWVWLISFLIAMFLPQTIPSSFDIAMIGIGLAYSLYVIGKNTLIGREISTSKLWSATIGACTTIVFIVFLVFGTVIGSKLGEWGMTISIGIWYFLLLLPIAGGILFLIETRRETSRFQFSLGLYRRLFFRYGIFMVALACFWQISVEASQVAINYSKEVFEKSNSASSLLLLFSSVWAILGNVLSVKFGEKRLTAFLVFSTFFIALIFWFSSLLGLAKNLDQYTIVQGLAFLVGLFFGWAVNLAESYFFSLLGEDPDKDYTSALYGFVLSFVGAVTMFASERILHSGSYVGISIFLWSLALFAIYGGAKGIRMKDQI